MQYRKVGHSDLEVSAVSLGTWVFGGDCWGSVDDSQSESVVKEALERGVTTIDTAPIYGSGRSEEVVGRAIKDIKGDVIIATKCGLEQKGKSITPNLTADFIRKEVEASLGRLGVETIDLYQCHWPDKSTPMSESFGELSKLVKEGKIRHIGVSNFSKELLEEAASIAPIVSNQVHYSIFHRDIEKDLVPFCREKGISILTYGSLGGGILSGKYKEPPSFPKGDVRSFFYTYYREPFWSKARALVSVLEEIASKHKVATSQVAIDWVLNSQEVASCIVGCRTSEQLEQNTPAADWKLSGEEFNLIQEEYGKVF